MINISLQVTFSWLFLLLLCFNYSSLGCSARHFPEWDMTTLEGILQRCGGVVSDAVDMVFAEFPPMNVCSNVSSTATCEPGNYNLWYCNNL